jgi:hypothetical protein
MFEGVSEGANTHRAFNVAVWLPENAIVAHPLKFVPFGFIHLLLHHALTRLVGMKICA